MHFQYLIMKKNEQNSPSLEDINRKIASRFCDYVKKRDSGFETYKEIIAQNIHFFLYKGSNFYNVDKEIIKQILPNVPYKEIVEFINSNDDPESKCTVQLCLKNDQPPKKEQPPPLTINSKIRIFRQLENMLNSIGDNTTNQNKNLINNLTYDGEYYLFYAIRFSFVSIVYNYIKKNDEWINITNKVIVPFLFILSLYHFIILYFFRKNNFILIVLINGYGPIHLAAQFGEASILDLLIFEEYSKADPSVKFENIINKPDNSGETPLMYAAKTPYNSEKIKILLSYGASISTENKNHQTALSIAVYNGNVENVKALLEYVKSKSELEKVNEMALKKNIQIFRLIKEKKKILDTSFIEKQTTQEESVKEEEKVERESDDENAIKLI